MKRRIVVFLLLAVIVLLSGCGAKSGNKVTIDYGTSSIYTKEDMDTAISLIMKEFKTWKGCELHSIRYASDEQCNAENLAWVNELEEARDAKEKFTQVISFVSDFHSPKNNTEMDAWNEDYEYTDWQWWLGRSDGGKWKLMDWGY